MTMTPDEFEALLEDTIDEYPELDPEFDLIWANTPEEEEEDEEFQD